MKLISSEMNLKCCNDCMVQTWGKNTFVGHLKKMCIEEDCKQTKQPLRLLFLAYLRKNSIKSEAEPLICSMHHSLPTLVQSNHTKVILSWA